MSRTEVEFEKPGRERGGAVSKQLSTILITIGTFYPLRVSFLGSINNLRIGSFDVLTVRVILNVYFNRIVLLFILY